MLNVRGNCIPLISGVDKATASAIFITDITLPPMLYGKTLKSPYPHAEIIKINVDKARKLPGVIAVITGADVPNNDRTIGVANADMNVLTTDKVRFIGDEIAAVAAVDEVTKVVINTANEATVRLKGLING